MSEDATTGEGVAHVKGVAFRSVIASVGELAGESSVERLYALLEERERSAIRYTVVNTGWYPIALYRALLSAAARAQPTEPAFVRRIGAAAIRRDVTGVYRWIFKAFSPETALAISGRLFGQYYDHGTLSVSEGRSGAARAEYRGCAGFDRNMWEELVGSAEALLTVAGATRVSAQIVSGGTDGCDRCSVELRWS